MLRRNTLLSLTISAFSLASASVGNAAVVLVGPTVNNGSFESPVGEVLNGTLTSWTIVGAIDVLRNPGGTYGDQFGPAFEGNQYIDMVGSPPPSDPLGGIYLDLITTAGTSYTLSFAYANNPNGQSPATANYGLIDGVLAGSTVASLTAIDPNGANGLGGGSVTHSSSVNGNPMWSTVTLGFTATSATTGLYFVATSGNDGGILLDAVSVVTPEPATLVSLAGIGACVAGAVVARRLRIAKSV